MFKVAIIGASGTIAKNHIEAYDMLKEDKIAQIAAYCDVNPENLPKSEGVNTYSDFNELLEKEKGNIDIIDVCLPTFLHKEVTVKALKAGYHVLCEKPMALNYEDAKAMYDTSVETGKRLMIAQPLRFMEPLEVIKDYVVSEKLGKFKSMEYSFHGRGFANGWFAKTELSGGEIFDVHVHDMDFIFWLLGDPESISAVANCKEPKSYDSISANLFYADGSFVNFRSDWKATSGLHEGGRNIRLNFENGYIIHNRAEFVKVEKDDKVTDLSLSDWENCFYKEIKYFLAGIENGTPYDNCHPAQSVNVIKAICSEMKSSDLRGERIMF